MTYRNTVAPPTRGPNKSQEWWLECYQEPVV